MGLRGHETCTRPVCACDEPCGGAWGACGTISACGPIDARILSTLLLSQGVVLFTCGTEEPGLERELGRPNRYGDSPDRSARKTRHRAVQSDATNQVHGAGL